MDRKSAAIFLGVALGVAAVATTAVLYATRDREASPRDVEAVFDAARETVRKLDDALEALRKSTPSS